MAKSEPVNHLSPQWKHNAFLISFDEHCTVPLSVSLPASLSL